MWSNKKDWWDVFDFNDSTFTNHWQTFIESIDDKLQQLSQIQSETYVLVAARLSMVTIIIILVNLNNDNHRKYQIQGQ